MRTWGRGGVVLLFLGLVAGCGSAGNSLTGGGIPIGRAAVMGSVVDSLGPDTPIAGADVAVAVDTASRAAAYTAQAVTDADGSFAFTGLPEGNATLQVTPPNGMPRRVLSAHVVVRNDETASVALCFEPDAPDYSVASLAVSPESIETTVGQPVTITAAATLPDGGSVRPSWVVEGGVGRISPRGHFAPTRAGTGEIRVRAGSLERVIPVTVRGD